MTTRETVFAPSSAVHLALQGVGRRPESLSPCALEILRRIVTGATGATNHQVARVAHFAAEDADRTAAIMTVLSTFRASQVGSPAAIYTGTDCRVPGDNRP